MAVSEGKVTRGKLLKRAGAGAAALGAGSMLTAATAQGRTYNRFCADCACGVCGGQVGCQNPFHPNLTGSCIPTTEGCCFCHQGSSCQTLFDLNGNCESSGDCPHGWACAASCCEDTYGLLCHPPVGVPAQGPSTGLQSAKA
jgi:hypothetical protein